MFYLLLIFAQYVLKILILAFIWFYQAIYALIDYFRSLFIKYFGNSWLLAIFISLAFYAVLLIVGFYQVPVMQFVDEVYSCGVVPVVEFGFAFADTVPEEVYGFFVTRWNDAVSTGYDCLVDFRNALGMLPGLDNIGFYTDIARATFDFFACLVLVPFETPSWFLPFGAQATLSSGVRLNLCVYQSLLLFITGITDYTLIRNDPDFCSYDPMADCPLRDNLAPFFPPTNIGLMECQEGIAIDCQLITCSLRAISNFSLPVEEALGIDISGLIEEIIEPTCCFFAATYKPPIWLGTGLISGCISIVDAPGFLLDEMVIPIRDCFIDIIFILSQGAVDNIFELLFAIIFDFIQIFIDSYNFLILCVQSQAGCFSLFPVTCSFDSNGVAVGGLQTCFSNLGNCIINGDAGIPPNPIITGPVFDVLLNDVIPGIFVFIDTLSCNLNGLIRCITGPDIGFTTTFPNCPSGSGDVQLFAAQITCYLNCIRALVPIFGDVASAFFTFANAIQNLIDILFDTFSAVIDFINEICDEINPIPGVGCPGGGIPNPFDLEFETPDNSTKYTDLLSFLNFYEIQKNTTCGVILYEYAEASDQHVHELEHDGWWGVEYRVCLALVAIAKKHKTDFPLDIEINDYMNFGTLRNTFSTYYSCKVDRDNLEREDRIKNGNFTNLENEKVKEDYVDTIENPIKFIRNTYNTVYSEYVRYLETGKTSNRDDPKVQAAVQAFQDKVNELDSINIKNIFSKVVSNVMDMEGFKMTKQFFGFMERIHDYYTRINYGSDSLMLIDKQAYINFTVGDLISTDDPYYTQMVQTASKWVAPYPEPKNEYENSMNQRQKQKFMEEAALDYVNVMYNHVLGIFQTHAYNRKISKDLKRVGYKVKNYRIVELNNRRIADMKDVELRQLIDSRKYFKEQQGQELDIPFEPRPRNYGTKVLTKEKLVEKQKTIREAEGRLMDAYKSLKRAGSQIDTDKVVNYIMDNPVLKSNHWFKMGHMFLFGSAKDRHGNPSISDEEFLSNFTEFKDEKLAYDVDMGFISKEEENELIRNRDNSSFHLYDLVTGNYEPRRQRKVGPFFSSKEGGWVDLRGYFKSWRRNVREYKLNLVVRKHGANFTQEQLKNFRFSTDFRNLADNWVFNTIEYVVNQIIQGIANIFFPGLNLRIDIGDIVFGWVDSFDPLEIIEDTATTFIDFVEEYFTCNVPEDFDGTNEYNFACIPYAPEALFSEWAVPVGEGNPFFPLQLGIFPQELITQQCVNTFNGNPNLFGPYRKSDNCPNMDGMDRPRCPFCDYCRRELQDCDAADSDGITNSLFYIAGITPVLLQEFYTGVLDTRKVQIFFNFYNIYILGLGGFTSLWLPYVAFVPIAGSYAVTRLLDLLFDNLAGGGRGGIPYGGVYVVALLLATYFLPFIFTSIPSFLAVLVLYGLAISWIVNLFTPFRGIRSGFALAEWFGLAFEFLDQAPQPLKFIPWTSAVEASIRYDYSDKAVPYLDTFCFFWTADNLFLIFFGIFIIIDLIQGLFQLAWPTWLFVVGLITATLDLVTKLRFWQTKEDVRDNQESIERLKMEEKKNRRALLEIFKYGTPNEIAPRIGSPLFNDHGQIVHPRVSDRDVMRLIGIDDSNIKTNHYYNPFAEDHPLNFE